MRVSVDADGIEGNNTSYYSNSFPSITEDGEYVVFTSEATNLIASDTNGDADVFKYAVEFPSLSTRNSRSSGSSALRRLFAKNRTPQTVGQLCNSSNLLKMGSIGEAVSDLQKELSIITDGIFGTQTQSATMNYQSNNDLKVDGIVGPQTRSALCK